MFGIRFPSKRSDFASKEKFFKDNGVEIRPIFYPINYHKHLIDNDNVIINDCTVAEELSKTTIMLPSYPELTNNQVDHIISVVNKYLEK
jgi:dTDP-4-amino-4,6-dideoxygalactose transaminase